MADLWNLVWGKPYVDARALAEAIERELDHPNLDFRTRLLIRDSIQALESHWGQQCLGRWLVDSRAGRQIELIQKEEFGEVGFPSLKERLVDATSPDTIRRYLRDLSAHVHRPVRLVIGGSVALILEGCLSRATEDIDVVDEVPADLRQQYALLERLQKTYGLQLTHFQSHFLPSGWEGRLWSMESLSRLQVLLVDPCDVFLSKLFSGREKDRSDLHALLPPLDEETVKARLKDTCSALLADPTLRQHAEQNWYILTGQALP